MLVASELFLLLRRDDGRAERATAQNGYGLAAAVVTDLIVAERVALGEEKDPRVRVLDDRPTGDPVLDPALARVVQKDGKRLSSLVTDRRLNPEGAVATALAGAGIVGIEEKRALGLVPARYPVRQPSVERDVRERLRTVLAGGSPSVTDAALLSILQGLDLASKVLADEMGTLSRKELKRRIEAVGDELAEGAPGAAVARAVQRMNAAIVSAAVVPAVISGS